MIVAMTAPTSTELVGPLLGFLGVIVGGLIVGGFAVYNRRRGNAEAKMPTTNELWAENRLLRSERDAEERKRRNVAETLDAVLALFRDFYERIRRGGSTALTPAEAAVLRLPIATDDDNFPTISPEQLDELRNQ